MPRIKCPKCSKVETVLRSGFIRKKQRYLCKECNYNFTIVHEDRKRKNQLKTRHHTTIFDIANAVGLSQSTVSRAIQNHPDISASTRLLVKQMAVEMDYHPNLFARNFASNRTNTVGVIIPSLEAAFFSTMLVGILRTASVAGYRVIICQSDERYNIEVDNVKTLLDNRVDGLLICHTMENGSYDQIGSYVKNRIPVIHFYRACAEADTSMVLAKDTEGGEQVTEHLIQQGCSRIGIVLGSKHFINSNQRLTGYRNALLKSVLSFDPGLVAYTDLSYAGVTAAIDKWLERDLRPDALMFISDQCAIYAIKHLKEQKISVPADICITGFGNNPIGEMLEPSLTTYEANISLIGETAMHLCLDEMKSEGPRPAQRIEVGGRLIIRDSSRRIERS
jgi:DNA-binding LacI/PurR family transcriptional regulator